MCDELSHENFILTFPHTRYQQSIHFFSNSTGQKFLIQIKDVNGNLKVSGVVFLRKSNNGKNKLYCPRGPIFNEDDITYFKEFLIKAEEFAVEYGASKIICNPMISDKHVEYLKKIGCDIISDPAKTMLPPSEICIKADNEAQMLAQMSKGCRKNTRKAVSRGLKSEETDKIDSCDMDKFYKLYAKTAQRKQFLMHDKKYFDNFLSKMDGRCLRFNKTYDGDKIVAMSIDYKYNKVLECIYSVSDSAYHNKKINNMLHWGRMVYCINSNDTNYFSCGGVYCDKNDKANKDYGVYNFKSGLCGGNIRRFIGDIIYKFNR